MQLEGKKSLIYLKQSNCGGYKFKNIFWSSNGMNKFNNIFVKYHSLRIFTVLIILNRKTETSNILLHVLLTNIW